MDAQSEKMIEVYSGWLNRHHAANEDDHQVLRAHYDEWDDPPRVLLDTHLLTRTIYERRIITLICSPYHDEGGPAILTGFFDDEGTLRTMLCNFDTDDSVIFINGAYDPATLPLEA